ncbi:porin family protein [Arcticibacterium luteifluviistationis]|uniref:Outer membrane protein beta-barrel domain-containing protein n=1 Tax=Arcticibacterium luteifluviistationis TaxID=1784714 RepID=A0A2Z4GBA9_9BACT|nr:porin family protein [Arcticibacterium luteifluviistationis]AWV98330.1 hypothetical protein DJ013_09165 [Arcticibacterium luteifluviistationis]
MKKILALLFTLIASAGFAQKSIGVRGAFTGSTMTKFDLIENITPDFKFLPSGSAAIFIEIPLDANFSVQPELAFTQKGFKVDEAINVGGDFLGINIPIGGRVNFKTNYIELPVLLKYHVGDKEAAHYYVALGPSLGYMADANMTVRVLSIFPIKTNLNNNMFKPLEFSGVAAMGFELPVAANMKAFVEGRYQHGFSRVLDTPIFQLPVRNRTLSGGLGVKFNI